MCIRDRDEVKRHLTADLTARFPGRGGVFPETLPIKALGFPSKESLRTFGMQLNHAPWFTGWFTPSEFLACTRIGRDPKTDPTNNDPNWIDLMFNTQTRPPESVALANELFRHLGMVEKKSPRKAAKVAVRKRR